jgi:hypothetical protein
MDDNKYLQEHPEVQQMIALVTQKLLEEQPDDPLQQAASMLSDHEGMRAVLAQANQAAALPSPSVHK